MEEQIKQIAQRLIGLRESLDMDTSQMAQSLELPVEQYECYESGQCDIPVSMLQKISHKYNVDLSALMFGNESHNMTYFLTRKDKGASVERTKAYKYQSLAAGFSGRKSDPFIVTVEPVETDAPVHLNTHEGEEFNLVLEGTLMLNINGKEMILEVGDSIYFNSKIPHGMRAIGGKPVRFLAVIL